MANGPFVVELVSMELSANRLRTFIGHLNTAVDAAERMLSDESAP